MQLYELFCSSFMYRETTCDDVTLQGPRADIVKLIPVAHTYSSANMWRFIMFYVTTNIYNKKTKRPTLMELFTATGNLKTFFYN
jgi:hypothetical protein